MNGDPDDDFYVNTYGEQILSSSFDFGNSNKYSDLHTHTEDYVGDSRHPCTILSENSGGQTVRTMLSHKNDIVKQRIRFL